MKKLVINTDGAAAPNPGPAAIGAIIRDDHGNTVATISQSIGRATNNQAEYRAMIAALQKALVLGADRVSLRSDSELVVRQLNGRYRVKKAELKPLYRQVRELLDRFQKFTVTHVPREQNREADKLAGSALK